MVSINENVSLIVQDISEGVVSTALAKGLRDLCGDDGVLAWIRDSNYCSLWKTIVKDLNKEFKRPYPEQDLNENENRAIQRFIRDTRKLFESQQKIGKASAPKFVAISGQAA